MSLFQTHTIYTYGNPANNSRSLQAWLRAFAIWGVRIQADGRKDFMTE